MSLSPETTRLLIELIKLGSPIAIAWIQVNNSNLELLTPEAIRKLKVKPQDDYLREAGIDPEEFKRQFLS